MDQLPFGNILLENEVTSQILFPLKLIRRKVALLIRLQILHHWK